MRCCEPVSLFTIERARCAVLLGPFNRVEVQALADGVGDMGVAQVRAARSFMADKMGMDSASIDLAGVKEACWSTNDHLCVKFASRDGARSLNSYKKNLPPNFNCDDFVPPVLRPLEDILIRVLSVNLASLQSGPEGSGRVRLASCR